MLDKIREIIANELDLEVEEVMSDSDIIEDLHADSLSIVTLIMEIEDYYGVTIPDEAILELRTPSAVAEYIENNS